MELRSECRTSRASCARTSRHQLRWAQREHAPQQTLSREFSRIAHPLTPSWVLYGASSSVLGTWVSALAAVRRAPWPHRTAVTWGNEELKKQRQDAHVLETVLSPGSRLQIGNTLDFSHGSTYGVLTTAPFYVINLFTRVGTVVKQSALQCRRPKRHEFDPWVSRPPGVENANPLQYSCLEEPWPAARPWSGKESRHDWATELHVGKAGPHDV